eukprot:GHVP01001568.1.p1 GENE.GHVP01001568.1~~GHVP01001568.1.p1  ORF type:complete len:568 (+),score=124.47 GHVP01001568.1:208-1911(+)
MTCDSPTFGITVPPIKPILIKPSSAKPEKKESEKPFFPKNDQEFEFGSEELKSAVSNLLNQSNQEILDPNIFQASEEDSPLEKLTSSSVNKAAKTDNHNLHSENFNSSTQISISEVMKLCEPWQEAYRKAESEKDELRAQIKAIGENAVSREEYEELKQEKVNLENTLARVNSNQISTIPNNGSLPGVLTSSASQAQEVVSAIRESRSLRDAENSLWESEREKGELKMQVTQAHLEIQRLSFLLDKSEKNSQKFHVVNETLGNTMAELKRLKEEMMERDERIFHLQKELNSKENEFMSANKRLESSHLELYRSQQEVASLNLELDAQRVYLEQLSTSNNSDKELEKINKELRRKLKKKCEDLLNFKTEMNEEVSNLREQLKFSIIDLQRVKATDDKLTKELKNSIKLSKQLQEERILLMEKLQDRASFKKPLSLTHLVVQVCQESTPATETIATKSTKEFAEKGITAGNSILENRMKERDKECSQKLLLFEQIFQTHYESITGNKINSSKFKTIEQLRGLQIWVEGLLAKHKSNSNLHENPKAVKQALQKPNKPTSRKLLQSRSIRC